MRVQPPHQIGLIWAFGSWWSPLSWKLVATTCGHIFGGVRMCVWERAPAPTGAVSRYQTNSWCQQDVITTGLFTLHSLSFNRPGTDTHGELSIVNSFHFYLVCHNYDNLHANLSHVNPVIIGCCLALPFSECCFVACFVFYSLSFLN